MAGSPNRSAAKGTGYQLVDWEMQNVMAILFYAWYGNTNCQKICGSGNKSTITESGQTNILGMTDTTSENGDGTFINFWGLENWWGSKSEWMQDVHTTGNGEITVDTPKSGGESRALSFPQSVTVRYPNKMKFGKYCDCIAMDNEGSDSSGYCDYQHSPSSAGYVAFRSYFGASLFCGLVYLYAGYDPSGTSSNRGARLAFRGVSREAASVSAFQTLQEA